MRMTPKTVRKWGYELVKVHHPPLIIRKTDQCMLINMLAVHVDLSRTPMNILLR
jgi:hypothetical protein